MTDLGKVIVIPVENDQRLSPVTDQRFIELARRVNKNVLHNPFRSKQKNAHSDSYFNYSEPTEKVLAYMFK